jgi:hypothetical protein
MRRLLSCSRRSPHFLIVSGLLFSLLSLLPACGGSTPAQSFPNGKNTAYYQRHQDRNQCNVQIVVELAHRLDKGPTVRPKHQNAIGRIQQTHASREE